jgi:aspartate aminotransferase-like enzyme
VILRSGRHFLQIPGPAIVPDRVLRAIAAPTIDHRGPEFTRLIRDVMPGRGEVSPEESVLTSADSRASLLIVDTIASAGSIAALDYPRTS